MTKNYKAFETKPHTHDLTKKYLREFSYLCNRILSKKKND